MGEPVRRELYKEVAPTDDQQTEAAFAPVTKSIETDRTNPEYIGPGHWDAMHKDTFNCLTVESQKECCKRIRDTCYTFNCKVCRGHCTEYIERNPPEQYIGTTWTDQNDGSVYMLGLAIWAWKFHNAVNQRLNKKQMRWDACFKMYTSLPDHCSSNCSEEPQKDRKSSYSPSDASPQPASPSSSLKPWYPGMPAHR
jgi:hypothetical protein